MIGDDFEETQTYSGEIKPGEEYKFSTIVTGDTLQELKVEQSPNLSLHSSPSPGKEKEEKSLSPGDGERTGERSGQVLGTTLPRTGLDSIVFLYLFISLAILNLSSLIFKKQKEMEKFIALIVSLVVSYFTAYPLGHWLAVKYKVGSGEFSIGFFPGYFDGFVISYGFFAPILFSFFSKKIRHSFYSITPFLILALFDFRDPWSKGFILASSVGLGLAWVILTIQNKIKKSPQSH